MTSEIVAVAKAVEATAEAGAEFTKASRDAGGFMTTLFGEGLKELAGIFHDNMRFRRIINLSRIQKKFEQVRSENGMMALPKTLPIKFGIPLIEAASLEEDDILRSMFATLLAKSTNEDGEEVQNYSFKSILEEMSGLDTQVLLSVYKSPPAEPRLYPIRTVYTGLLPDFYLTNSEHNLNGRVIDPLPKVQLSLWKLAKLGCVAPAGLWDGAASIGLVTVTALGIALVEACTTTKDRQDELPPAVSAPPNLATSAP